MTDGDRLRKVSYPSGGWVEYFYDPEGRPLARLGTERGVAVADIDTSVVEATRARHTMLADHRADLGQRVRFGG